MAILTIILYLTTAFLQYLSATDRLKPNGILIRLLAVLAIFSHGVWLHQTIDLPQGQDINVLNMLSFMIWFTAVVLTLVIFRQFFQDLSMFVFPLAACSIFLALFFPMHPVIKSMTGHAKQWLHVWLAALTLGFIFISALEAILLFVQDRLLHHYQHVPSFIRKMPPIQSMERLLFKTIFIAFFLLTVTCISSIYFFNNVFQFPVLQKTFLVLITWIVLLVLLMGRHLFGWRGRKAILFTLISFFSLIFIYFSAIFIHY